MNSPPNLAKSPRCPICDAPAAPPHAPFCSRGCKDRDLLNWLGDAYRVPAAPADEEALDTHEDRD